MKITSKRNEVPNWAVVAFAIIGFLLGLLVGYFMWASPTPVEALTNGNNHVEVCWDCPTFDFHAKECPAGYRPSIIKPDKCYKSGRGYVDYLTFDLLNIQRVKSQDPNKCHKPTPETLNVPTWARSDYGKLAEHVPGKVFECPTPTPVPTVLVCLDNGQDEPKELTIPRTQEAWDRVLFSWPQSYVGECKVPEPTPEPTPTPTPSEEPKHDDSAEGSNAPETCTASVPEPAMNVHGYRKGGTFEVKWYPAVADGVNIYYYQNQVPENKHSVINTDNDGSEFINGLGSLDWTFGVQSLNGGCAGSEIRWVEDGLTDTWVLFR